MADDEEEAKETPKAPAAPNPDHVTKAELEAHKKEWERHKQELKDELAELHASDKAEREELRQQLDEATQYIKELKEAEARRDEVKGSKSTIVVPPTDIPPQQPQPTTPPTSGPEARKRGIFSRVW